MTARIAFDVAGLPVGQAALRQARSGHAYYQNGAELRPWKATLAAAASEAMAGREPLGTALAVRVTFRLPRPKGHFGVRGLLPSAPAWPAKRPDLDHLIRALDALSGIVWRDDAQVVHISANKAFGSPGASVEVTEWVA